MLREKLRELIDEAGLKLTERQKGILAADLYKMVNTWIDSSPAERGRNIKAARERSLIRLGLEPEQLTVLIDCTANHLSAAEVRKEVDRYGKRLLRELVRAMEPSKRKRATPVFKLIDVDPNDSSISVTSRNRIPINCDAHCHNLVENPFASDRNQAS